MVSGEQVDVKPGNAMPLSYVPVGTIVHNIEMKSGKGGQIARAAGTYAQISAATRGTSFCAVNSGESAGCGSSARRPSARCPTRTT